MVNASVSLDKDILRRFDASGPRYTSYPTADRFIEAFDANVYESWVRKRGIGGFGGPLSLYVHLPFCSTVCFYCGCNKVVTKDRSKASNYLKYLAKEISLQSAMLDRKDVVQMHWGGGTPTFLSNSELRQLMDMISGSFARVPEAESSIEVDPRSVDPDTVGVLAEIGITRISIGVQDFDPEVQKAVNRLQSEQQTLDVIAASRKAGLRSVNLDLIYGLPKQTTASFGRTLDKTIAADPDRIALYNYAHLPHVFKPQRRINEADLPNLETRLQIFSMAVHRLAEAGYVYIGMDHFAKPDDDLAVAQRRGRLHRNFQGYSTHADCDLIGLGVSAIGKVGPTYSQNQRSLEEYYGALDHDVLPIMRGIELSADDLLRRALIQALMCHFEVSIESIEIAHLVEFPRYFAHEIEDLRPFIDAGLVELDDEWLSVTPSGRFVVRSVCMVFDRYLREGRQRASYSKVM